MLPEAQDVLTQSVSSKGTRTHWGGVHQGSFLTYRNFLLGFCEHFISPNSPLMLQRAGFLGLSHTLQQRMALSCGGQSIPFISVVYSPVIHPKPPEVPPNKIWHRNLGIYAVDFRPVKTSNMGQKWLNDNNNTLSVVTDSPMSKQLRSLKAR